MSEVLNIIAGSVADRAPSTADPVVNLATGATFSAEIEGNLDPFLLPEAWSRDPRAKFKLHVGDHAQAAGISVGDKVRFQLMGVTTTAKILIEDIDPASPMTVFLAIHMINGKDA